MDIQCLSLRVLNFSPKPLMANYTQIWDMVSAAGTVVILQSVRDENILKAGEGSQCTTRHFLQVPFHYFTSYSSASKAKNFPCQISMLFFTSLSLLPPKYVLLNNAHNVLPHQLSLKPPQQVLMWDLFCISASPFTGGFYFPREHLISLQKIYFQGLFLF